MNSLIVGGAVTLIGLGLTWGNKGNIALLGIIIFIVGMAIIIKSRNKNKR